ncbi:phenylacetate--CoA ligase family protein [Flavobacterium silvisoli]|uniref:Phenylacetate--CoA ligase family protein n=1 Tax=Flavobacterium silvisoli TaxID=2529433 RepID=A0A4Q9Z500_9FLAO|nr:phenylacetate--CoA ligase family protein [Flavobacterium silvisoli]TBX71240.1 phenylacetate--CoA ligase family protein [Flavobacterium silvisoli]
MLNIFDLSLRLNGFPMDEASAELKRIQSLSASDYENYVTNRRNEIVDYHLKNNVFYAELVSNNSFSLWESLPVMTKKDFQKPLNQRLSNGYTLNDVYVNKTSGSSGDPFVFAKDKYCHALTWANIINRFGWFDINFNSSLQARFYGIPLDFTSNLKERIKDFLSHRYRFSIFDLSDAFLEKILLKFKHKKFDYINGYTSSIVLFAKFLEQKNILLKTVCPTLKCCVVTSEMLFEDDKKLLEKQFGVPVINEYGASELDLIAFQNPDGDWQINSETLFVEILDNQNNALPYGKEGRIVITSLYNKAHPFIRYDIGDIGVLDEKSTIKKPILKKLIGRTNDVALLPSGKKSPGLTFYYVTKSIIQDDGNVKEFVVKQTKIDTFEIEYVSQLELTSTQIQNIEKAITSYLEPGLTFTFIRKEKLERTKSGKLKQFVSLLK